jgi:hypothetical protein
MIRAAKIVALSIIGGLIAILVGSAGHMLGGW